MPTLQERLQRARAEIAYREYFILLFGVLGVKIKFSE